MQSFFLYTDSVIKEQPGHDPGYQVHDPFGRPGNGAPLKDTDGYVHTQIHGKMKREVKQQVRVYLYIFSK